MESDGSYVGHVDCDERCEVPKGMKLFPIPRPRHAWGDVIVCPHCGAAFMMRPLTSPQTAAALEDK